MPSPTASLAQMIKLLAFQDKSLIKRISSISDSATIATIVCYDSNETLSRTDKLMGANARRKTAYELDRVLDEHGKVTKRLPRCLFQALNASLRIKQQLKASKSFFETLGRLGKIKIMILDCAPQVSSPAPQKQAHVAKPRPTLVTGSIDAEEEEEEEVEEKSPERVLVQPETPDAWDEDEE